MTYICLLRGINVGGKNIIKMADLRDCLTNLGLENVNTYIQSGNIVFDSKITDKQALSKQIEDAINEQFGFLPPTLLLSKEDLDKAINQAPKSFGSKPEKYRYDVIFLFPEVSAKEALDQIEAKEGVDTVNSGDVAIYFSRLVAKATQSKLSKIIKKPIYQKITIRNWRTTNKLVEMVE